MDLINIILNKEKHAIVTKILNCYCFKCQKLRIHQNFEEIKILQEQNKEYSNTFYYNISIISNYNCCDTKNIKTYFYKDKFIFKYIATKNIDIYTDLELQTILQKEITVNEAINILKKLTKEEIEFLNLNFDITKIYDENYEINLLNKIDDKYKVGFDFEFIKNFLPNIMSSLKKYKK